MASSVRIMGALERGGVQSHVVSASAALFVKGAAQSLGIPVVTNNVQEFSRVTGLIIEDWTIP